MIRGKCPTCSRAFEIASLDALPPFPSAASAAGWLTSAAGWTASTPSPAPRPRVTTRRDWNRHSRLWRTRMKGEARKGLNGLPRNPWFQPSRV